MSRARRFLRRYTRFFDVITCGQKQVGQTWRVTIAVDAYSDARTWPLQSSTGEFIDTNTFAFLTRLHKLRRVHSTQPQPRPWLTNSLGMYLRYISYNLLIQVRSIAIVSSDKASFPTPPLPRLLRNFGTDMACVRAVQAEGTSAPSHT